MPDTYHLPARFLLLVIVMLTALSLFAGHPAIAENTKPLPTLTFTGSSSLANLVSLWADAFRLRYPVVSFSVADSGSAVGLESLLNGSADAVLLSSPLHKQQQQRFIDRYGYAPTLIPVAHDGITIVVNTLNPLKQVTLPQLDAIFSRTLRCGEDNAIHHWGELGLKADLTPLTVATFGLNADSGAYYLFRSEVLCGGDFRSDFQAMAGPGGVQTAISHNRAAIGFIGSSQIDPELRAIPIARHDRARAISPDPDAIRSGRYPLARTLSIAYNVPPEHDMSPLLRTFINFVLSPDGQDIAAEAGYVQLEDQL